MRQEPIFAHLRTVGIDEPTPEGQPQNKVGHGPGEQSTKKAGAADSSVDLGRRAVRVHRTPRSATLGSNEREGLFDVPGLAEFLGVSEKFVRRLVDERRIRFIKVGRLVRFEPAEVLRWVASCAVDAVR